MRAVLIASLLLELDIDEPTVIRALERCGNVNWVLAHVPG
jgi:hypothetical protein